MKSDYTFFFFSSRRSRSVEMIFFTILFVDSFKTVFPFSRRPFLFSSFSTSKTSLFSAVDETLLQEEQQKEQQQKRVVVPIINSASLQISAMNPFGSSVGNLKTSEIKDEIISLANNRYNIQSRSSDLKYMEPPDHFRLEYLVKVLEQRYIPIQTIPFLNLVFAGTWSKLYTNTLSRKADSNLDYNISNHLQPNDDDISSAAAGQYRDVIMWQYKEESDPEHTVTGSFEVRSRYELSSRGELQLSLEQYLLLPDAVPQSIGFEELVQSIQRSIPFENFDPDGVTVTTTYIDGDFRIVRLSGEKFYNVFNIFHPSYTAIEPSPPTSSASFDEYKNLSRRVMSRKSLNSINLVGNIKPGTVTEGCLVCCYAPSFCPLCSILPCCGDAEYIQVKRLASTYIHIRENSIEWNEPTVVMKPGLCCGVDPCEYDVQDNVSVLYFDDKMFDRISDQTRCCNECRTCLLGGKGERVHFASPICCGCCQLAAPPCPCLCVPVCCPQALCPCVLQKEIYMEDAQKGLYEIKKAVGGAMTNELYNTNFMQYI